MTDDSTPASGGESQSVDVAQPAEPSRARWSARRRAIVWGSVGAATLLLVAGGTALALAGGGGVPVPTPVPTTQSPVPSATPEAVAMPVSALPLECDALVPDAERALLIGAGSVVNVDEATAPHPDFAMMRQAGVLTCDWDGSEGTSLGAYVLPDGADVYQSSFADEPPSAYNTLDSVGDRSIFYCNSYGEVQCNAYLLVDDYLIEFFWTSSLTDEEASKAVMQDALEGIVDRIRDAGPARELVVLPSGTDAKRVCSDAALEAASAAFDSKVIRSGGDAGSIGFWTSRVQTGAAICLWGAERLSDAIRPLGLPGGAWAIEAWRQTRPDEIVAGLGRDGDGVVTCVPTACYAFAAFGDDLLAFEAPPDDESDMEEIASEFFAALR